MKIFNIIGYTITVLIVIFLCNSVVRLSDSNDNIKPDSTNCYINDDFIITKKIYQEKGVHNHKSLWPTFVVKYVKDTTIVGLIDIYNLKIDCNKFNHIYNTKQIGDTLHFDYIRKERFNKYCY